MGQLVRIQHIPPQYGRLAEGIIATTLKVVDQKWSVSSNLTSSAKFDCIKICYFVYEQTSGNLPNKF